MVLSGPVNPNANNAKSHGHVFSVPAISINFGRSPGTISHSTLTVFKAVSFPFLSVTNSFVLINQLRSTPSL